jgi:hypothetical protein
MRNEKGTFARGGAIAGAVLVGLSAASAFAADGTLKVNQGSTNPATPDFNGQNGGGEFGVYEFVNNNAALTLLPISATAKVNAIVNFHGPYDFQTFCLEPGEHISFDTTLNWTAATSVQLNNGSTRNLDPRTAYLFYKFWTATAFSPASPNYNYTLGAGRRASAADLQLAIWFTEGVSGFNSGNTALYTADAAAAVAPGGFWFNFTGGTGFPGNLGGVRALNIDFNGTREQDVLAIFTTETPPVEPPGDCSGKTPGFWHNKNGCELVKDSGAGANWSWLTVINQLPLVDGTDDGHLLANVPLSKDGFNTISDFLVSGNNAKNMAQKLSQHLAAMTFNVLAGFADGDCLVYTGDNADCIPGSPDTVSIGEVLLLAIDTLDTTDGDGDTYTPDGDPLRHYQECLKNILDDANNNLNWVN